MISKIRISAGIALLIWCLLITNTVNAQYHSLCWRISGGGLAQPSYLYGTMHVSDKRVFDFSDKSQKAFESSRAFAMELDPEKALSLNIISSLMMTDGSTISKLIPDSDYHFLDSILTSKAGFSMVLFDHMEPIIVSTMLEEYAMGMTITDTTNMYDEMDLYFYKKAKKAKKKLIGIESVDEQIGALHSLSYKEQAELLTQSIADMKNPGDNSGKDLLKYYIDQNLDSLLAMSDEHQMPPKFYKALVTDRNAKMAQRIDGFIKKQSTFIAIGALHLPGSEGVIALLRKKGYTVEVW
jgi:uncharacterized protein YbaP (TraB family)